MRQFAVLLLLVTPRLAQAQEPAVSPATAATAAAGAAVAADQTASPELVAALVKDIAITPAQAEGAAGTLFGVARARLAPADFAKVAAAVPNMEGLLKAAPAPAKASPAASLAGKASAALGGAATAATAASTLSKLGLKPDQIVKLTPALVQVVQSRGGAEVAALLAGALK